MPDQVPPGGDITPAVLYPAVARVGERVAALEARVTAEVSALQKDTSVIRASMHDIAQSLQLTVIEMRLLTSQSATQNTELGKMRDAMESVQADRKRLEGAWWAIGKLVAVIVFVGSAIAGVVTFLQHLLTVTK